MKPLISFEGIDGCGKTTQIKLLSKYFNNNNLDHIIVREPGGIDVSEKIRNILLDKDNEISNISETLLFLAARSQLVEDVIDPRLNKNRIVLCDRFIDSTVAYQGYGHKLSIGTIEKMNLFSTNNLLPDLTIIFDINPMVALQRIKEDDLDRMESMGIDYIQRVREGYLEISRDNSDRCRVIRCNKKDSMSIHKEVISLINILNKGI